MRPVPRGMAQNTGGGWGNPRFIVDGLTHISLGYTCADQSSSEVAVCGVTTSSGSVQRELLGTGTGWPDKCATCQVRRAES